MKTELSGKSTVNLYLALYGQIITQNHKIQYIPLQAVKDSASSKNLVFNTDLNQDRSENSVVIGTNVTTCH